MNLIPLAWKNLSRYRRRSLITASALAVGLTFFVIVDSMLKGADSDSLISLTRYETGSGEIGHPEHRRDGGDLDMNAMLTYEETVRIGEKLSASGIPYAPRIHFTAEILIDLGSFPVKATGVDPERDDHVFSLKKRVIDGGRYLSSDSDNGETVLLGSWLAEDLGLNVGDTITLFFTESQDAAFLEVCGILDTPNPIINREGVFISVDTAQYYLDREGISGFSLLSVDDPTLSGGAGNSLVKNLQHLLKEEEAQFISWRILAKDYLVVSESKKGGSKIFLFLIFLVAAIGISNTLLMSLLERTKEIGMMRALGLDERGVFRLFLWEAVLIGFLGSCGGVILGAAVNFYLVRYGIDYGDLLRNRNLGYRILSVLYGKWSVETFITAFFSGITIAFMVGFLSLRRALKRSIVDCLRYH